MSDLFDSIVREAAARSGVRPSLSIYAAVWPAIVGDDLARHSAPCGLNADELVVEVSQAWLRQVERSRTEIEKQLKTKLPWDPPSLRFVAGHIPARSTRRKKAAAPASEPDESKYRGGEEEMEQLDEPLRETLRQIREHLQRES